MVTEQAAGRTGKLWVPRALSAPGEPAQKVLLSVQPSAVCGWLLLGVTLPSIAAEGDSSVTHKMGLYDGTAEVGSAVGVVRASEAVGRRVVSSPCAKGLPI